jgi:hypothetical protein
MANYARHSLEQPQKAQHIGAGWATHNYFEVRYYSRRPCYCRIERCRIRGHHLVRSHGRPHIASGDPGPDPSGAACRHRVRQNHDHDRGLALCRGRS